jgi:hypothetical protein
MAIGFAGMLAFSVLATAQNGDFSDQQINQFVDAQSDVMEIRDEYVQRIESAEDRDDVMALEQEANQMMVEAVEETGLTVDTYSDIAQSASENPELAERIRSVMSN